MRTVAEVDGYLTFLKNNSLVAWILMPTTREEVINCYNRWEQEGQIPSDSYYPD